MVRIGILTTAHIHTPNFVNRLKARTDVQIVGLWDPCTALADKYSKELNCPKVDTCCKLIDDPTIDAIVITGTTAQHDGLAVKVAKAKKHLFIEKPLATTVAEANKIFHAVKNAGVTFQTGHFMRSGGMMQFVRNEVRAGNLGTITRARCSNVHHGALGGWFDKDYRWFFDATQAGGGGFYDLGCHALDLLVHFFGPAVSATAAIGGQTIKYSTIDEYGEGLLRFANGAIGTITGGWVDHANPNFLLISGTEGHLHVTDGKLYYKSSKSSVPGADGKQPIDAAHLPADLPHAFELFFDVLLGKQDKSVLIPIEDALNVVKAMDAMYTGDKLGQWVKVG